MIKLSNGDWIINNVDTILFDKDGTLIDLDYFWGKITEMRVEKVILTYGIKKELYDTFHYPVITFLERSVVLK